MEFTALCPSTDFKYVSSLYFTKDLHCEIVNELIGSNIIFNREPIETSSGEIYVMEPDFHLISTKTEISIYWHNLDYERIKEYNNKIINYLGLSKYYWDIQDRKSGELLAECRSGVFELDGEISISNPANRKYDNKIGRAHV